MRVQINNEFRDYSEALFFGLNMRQLIFSALACGAAVGSYFLLKKHFRLETLSWLCILIASPFATLGFVKYNGMNTEQIVWAWIECNILMHYELKFRSENAFEKLGKAEEEKGKKRDSKTYRFTDLNYSVASDEDKRDNK